MAGDLLKSDAERRRKIAIFGVLILLAGLLLASKPLMLWVQATQEHLITTEIGTQARNAVTSPAQEMTRSIAGGLGLVSMVNDANATIASRATVVLLELYSALWRLVYFGFMILMAAPVLIAAFMDGLMRRKISQWRYEYPSPIRHFVSRNTAVRLFDAMLFAIVLPLPIPPAIVLLWLLAMGLSLRSWAANLQQRM